jgi:hypothetical protein
MTLNAPFAITTRAPNGSFSFNHRGQASRSAPARAFPNGCTTRVHQVPHNSPEGSATVVTKRSRWGISASRPRTQWCAAARPYGTPEPYTILVGVPDTATKNSAISVCWRRNHPWNPQNPRIMMMAGKFVAPFALHARNVHGGSCQLVHGIRSLRPQPGIGGRIINPSGATWARGAMRRRVGADPRSVCGLDFITGYARTPANAHERTETQPPASNRILGNYLGKLASRGAYRSANID